MESYVFVELIIIIPGTIKVRFDVCVVPIDYFKKKCYLCSGVYEKTKLYKWSIYKDVYACSECYNQNWHKLS